MHTRISITKTAIIFAVIAAFIAALSPPLCKIVVTDISPVTAAALLNLGAGIGIGILGLLGRNTPVLRGEKHLSKSDIPWISGLAVTEMLAAISMMAGLSLTAASNASLLNNFETVTTAVIALILFKEMIPRRLWFAIILITVGCMAVSFQGMESFTFSPGSLLIVLACVFWGFENNFMKKTADKNPVEVVACKGIFPGIGALVIALILGEQFPAPGTIAAVMALGVVIYGLNILFLVYSERHLGAAKACAIYGINPFLAAIVSCIIFLEIPGPLIVIAFVLMIPGVYLAATARRKGESRDDNAAEKDRADT